MIREGTYEKPKLSLSRPKKFKVDHYLQSLYKTYDRITPESLKVDKVTYHNILSDFNMEIRDAMIYQNYTWKLPFMLGRMRIVKHKMNFGRKIPMDYAQSSKEGYKIYHLNEERQNCLYRIRWEKSDIRIPNRSMYYFVPCRTFKRTLAKVLKTRPDIDFFEE